MSTSEEQSDGTCVICGETFPGITVERLTRHIETCMELAQNRAHPRRSRRRAHSADELDSSDAEYEGNDKVERKPAPQKRRRKAAPQRQKVPARVAPEPTPPESPELAASPPASDATVADQELPEEQEEMELEQEPEAEQPEAVQADIETQTLASPEASSEADTPPPLEIARPARETTPPRRRRQPAAAAAPAAPAAPAPTVTAPPAELPRRATVDATSMLAPDRSVRLERKSSEPWGIKVNMSCDALHKNDIITSTGVSIEQVTENSIAEAAGITSDFNILYVDGHLLAGKTNSEARHLMSFPHVELGLIRKPALSRAPSMAGSQPNGTPTLSQRQGSARIELQIETVESAPSSPQLVASAPSLSLAEQQLLLDNYRSVLSRLCPETFDATPQDIKHMPVSELLHIDPTAFAGAVNADLKRAIADGIAAESMLE